MTRDHLFIFTDPNDSEWSSFGACEVTPGMSLPHSNLLCKCVLSFHLFVAVPGFVLGMAIGGVALPIPEKLVKQRF